MYSAVEPREGIDLDMLHKSDHAPIRYARICTKDGEEVPWENIVKGYEYRDGDYIVLTPKDLDELDVKKTQTVETKKRSTSAILKSPTTSSRLRAAKKPMRCCARRLRNPASWRWPCLCCMSAST
jgi:hypothetical protein